MFSEHAYVLKFEVKEKFSMLPQPLISRSRNAFQECGLVKILDDELLLFLVYKGLLIFYMERAQQPNRADSFCWRNEFYSAFICIFQPTLPGLIYFDNVITGGKFCLSK